MNCTNCGQAPVYGPGPCAGCGAGAPGGWVPVAWDPGPRPWNQAQKTAFVAAVFFASILVAALAGLASCLF